MSFEKRDILYKETTIKRNPPINLKKEHTHIFEHEFTRYFDDAYIYHYTNTIITGKGLAIQKQKKSWHVIPQSVSTEQLSLRVKLNAFAQVTISKTIAQFQDAIYFTDDNSHGYFHWITEGLAKLLSIPHIINSDYIILIPEKFFSPLVNETLQMLNINPTQIFIIPENTHVCVENLLVVGSLSLPTGSGNYRPDIIKQVQKTIASKITLDKNTQQLLLAKYGTKIYISRADARYRYIVNEQECIPLLTKFGYSTMCASELTFSEQVFLFSQASTIISLHGAGLTNMVWMNSPKARVVEIRSKTDNHNNCYFSLASAVGIDYYYSFAQSKKNADTHKANFVWNNNSVRLIMETLHG